MIRKINMDDKALYMELTTEFYASDAVMKPVPNEYIENTFSELMRSDDYLECYILSSDDRPAGYALLAKTFSQEAGGLAVWLEEIYIRDEFRGKGLGSEFFEFLKNGPAKDAKRIRLEVEEDNKGAIRLYERQGFTILPYMQMIKDFD